MTELFQSEIERVLWDCKVKEAWHTGLWASVGDSWSCYHVANPFSHSVYVLCLWRTQRPRPLTTRSSLLALSGKVVWLFLEQISLRSLWGSMALPHFHSPVSASCSCHQPCPAARMDSSSGTEARINCTGCLFHWQKVTNWEVGTRQWDFALKPDYVVFQKNVEVFGP